MQLCMKNVLMNAVMIVMIRLPIFSALGFLSNRIINNEKRCHTDIFLNLTQKSQKSQKRRTSEYRVILV